MAQPAPPVDASRPEVYFAFMGFGFAFLLLYTTMLAAVDYYVHCFGEHFMFSLSPALLVPNLAILFLRVFLSWLPNDRLNVSLGFVGLCVVSLLAPFAATPAQVLWLAVLCSICTALTEGSCFALAALAGVGCGSAVQTGMGVAAVATLVVRSVVKMLAADWWSSVVFQFAITVIFQAGALAAYEFWFVRLDFMRNLMVMEAIAEGTGTAEAGDPMLCDERGDHGAKGHTQPWQDTWSMRALLLSGFLNFCVTLSLYPGVIAEFHASDVESQGWLTLALFSVYSVTDLVGKCCPTYKMFRLSNSSTLLVAVTARLVFLPLFLRLAQAPQTSAALVLWTSILGFTTGLFGSMTFELIPELVDVKHRAKAGTALSFFVLGGIAAGSVLASVLFQPA